MKGEGNQQDYGMRVYDPRIAKFLSVDPLTQEYPWYTPYQFAGNTPIQATDRDGAEEELSQLGSALRRNAALQKAKAGEVGIGEPSTGTIKATVPNWGAKWKAWNDSKSPTHTVGFFSRLLFAAVNDAKIAYASAVDGKNHAVGIDNGVVSDYKERVGAGLNTIWLFNPLAGGEARLESALADVLVVVGSAGRTQQVSKRLTVHNAEGYKWSLMDINARNREFSAIRQNCTNCVIALDAF
ncbi:hypothetical protein HHL17_09890 [Chitinophaga sp. G-6-1-13]|uniref:RHS repeat-associated core domain-containing protein n=1 Tax=Chitinophaga fulva TaxID=2728842 RepID=A0A848GLC5_9BACT|nr:hypothetical protein [Chitinophaga fulva]